MNLGWAKCRLRLSSLSGVAFPHMPLSTWGARHFHHRPHTDCRRSSPSSGRTRDQYAAVVGKKVRAIEKKLKRISTIETNAASSGVNDQQAGLLAKKPQLLSSLQDYRALLESFKTITAKVRTAVLCDCGRCRHRADCGMRCVAAG